ncbi:MAG: 3-deoxy-D-manno-octulosonic acid transferase [Chlamydiales bacterium]
MRFFGLFYDFCLHLLAAGMLPKMGFETLKNKKYRSNFKARLGLRFPPIDKGDKQLIWVHAVSVGETKAIAPLVKRLKKLDPAPLVLLSTVTETGFAEGKKSIPEADWHVYLPFDLSYLIRPIIKKVSPDFILLTETDFWYHFHDEGKKRGAQLFLVNGKLSQRSYQRFMKFPLFAKHLLHPIDHFFVQADLYRHRLEQLRIPSSKISVTGNIKLDGAEPPRSQEEIHSFKTKLGLSDQLVLTLGSTHYPEEQIWVKALKKLWTLFPTLKVMIVPRHPERCEEVARYLSTQSLSFGRWSQKKTFNSHRILLIDAMGVLSLCYQLSDIAFVGGSFTPKVGGHNILEPSFYGKPVLFGPYLHGQPALFELMQNYQGGVQIEEREILPVLEKLLSSPTWRDELGKKGLQLIADSKGALEATWKQLLPLLQKKNSC